MIPEIYCFCYTDCKNWAIVRIVMIVANVRKTQNVATHNIITLVVYSQTVSVDLGDLLASNSASYHRMSPLCISYCQK